MMILILGGSASGKSALAETLAVKVSDGPLYYIATMQVHDSEDLARVDKHRSMRNGKGFITLEQPRNISAVTVPQNATLLVECLSNLLANEMYGGQHDIPDITKKITSEFLALSRCSNNIIIVSNEVFADGTLYNDFCMEYIHNLGKINAKIADLADVVIEAVAGIPMYKKGEQLCTS